MRGRGETLVALVIGGILVRMALDDVQLDVIGPRVSILAVFAEKSLELVIVRA